MSGEIGDKEFEITCIKPDTNKAKLEVEDRRFIFRRDEIEATIGAQLAAQMPRKIPKGYNGPHVKTSNEDLMVNSRS